MNRHLHIRAALLALALVSCLVLAHRVEHAVSADPGPSPRSAQAEIPRSDPTDSPAPSSPAPAAVGSSQAAVRLPGEFETQEALLLSAAIWEEDFPGTLCAVIAATEGKVRLLGVVPDAAHGAFLQNRLRGYNLPADVIDLIVVPHDTAWIRDYGPVFVQRGSDNERTIVDLQYLSVGLPGEVRVGPPRVLDEEAPTRLGSILDFPVAKAPMTLEGGNLLSNGQGICLTTTLTLQYNLDRPYDEAAVAEVFHEYFGAATTCILEPLAAEPTGHVDMYATFTAPDTVVVGSYHPAEDPVNAALLDRNAEKLAQLETASGPLRVVRIPMPPHRDGCFRTYANVLFANGTLLVPSYPGLDVEGQRQAMATYRELLPGWNVVGIDLTGVITENGGLHCLATPIPPGSRPWAEHGNSLVSAHVPPDR